MVLDNLVESILMSDIVSFDDYTYFINGIGDGFPSVDPKILVEICNHITSHYNFRKINKIVGIEAMGIPIAVMLSYFTEIPYVIIRKRQYNIDGEVAVHKSTGYEESNLFINDINEGDNIFLVDDIISTGGTLIEVINTLKDMGVFIQDVVCVIGKNKGTYRVKEKTGIPVDTIVYVGIDEFDKLLVERCSL